MRPFANGVKSFALSIQRNIDEVFVPIQGLRKYLWRAVDQDGDVIDIFVQDRRNQQAAKRFFRRLLKGQRSEPRWLITDKLRSDDVAHRSVMPTVEQLHKVYANNRAKVSLQPTRERERAMQGMCITRQNLP